MAVFGNNILITFDMIMDTDLGLIKLIQNYYNDHSVFNNDIINIGDSMLKALLRKSIHKNPLSIIMNDYNKKQADGFYNEFIETEYNKILELSERTSILDVVRRFIDSESQITPTILCRTDKEAEIVQTMVNRPETLYSIITVQEYNEVELKGYDTIFLKNIDDLLKFNQTELHGKNIMISDLAHNLDLSETESKLPKREFVVLYASYNEFYTITLYHYDELYYEEGDLEDER